MKMSIANDAVNAKNLKLPYNAFPGADELLPSSMDEPFDSAALGLGLLLDSIVGAAVVVSSIVSRGIHRWRCAILPTAIQGRLGCRWSLRCSDTLNILVHK